MVPDRNDNTPELDDDENGVLTDTGSIDTTGIAIFGSTEHVSLSMPVGSEDDDFDADDAVDAIVADEIAVDLGVAPELAPVEVAAIESVESVEPVDAGDDAVDADIAETVPDEPQEDAVVAEVVHQDDDAPVSADVPEVPADAVEEMVEVVVVDAVDAVEVHDEIEAEIEPEPDTAAEEPLTGDSAAGDAYAAFAAAGFDVGNVDTEAAEAEEFEFDGDGDNAAAGDASAGDDLEHDPDEIAADDKGTAVDEANPITDPLSREALRKAMEEQEKADGVDRARENERIAVTRQEVVLTSKRVGELEPDRESADLLTADRLLDHNKVGRSEPEGAWQQFVYSISGKRINLGDGKRARARKELDRRISVPLTGGARFIPVLSRKGGVGKTTITALLGMALADARDDRVIAIDANPDRGTLAERIARPSGRTVRDLARLRGSVNGFNDISTIVARDETRLDVISSDSDPHVSEAFSDHDYRDVAAVAAHYYSLVLTDTGTGIVHSVMGATLDMSDEIVIVAGLSVDEARLASETLTWLEANGFADKVRRAVVVLNNSRPGSPLVLPQELEAHFRSRVRAVVRMPYDAHIGGGGAITFRDLAPATRDAARQLAAIVVEGLRSLDAAA